MWMWSTGINRNIVECKDSFFGCPLVLLLVLIETLWNVKIDTGTTDDGDYIVLIETLWNVKVHRCDDFFPNVGVLIETLWNVKTHVV